MDGLAAAGATSTEEALARLQQQVAQLRAEAAIEKALRLAADTKLDHLTSFAPPPSMHQVTTAVCFDREASPGRKWAFLALDVKVILTPPCMFH